MSTPNSDRRPLRRRAGFTLAEIMIGSALGTMVLAAVLTSFTMLVRSGTRATNYATMESHTRRALELLGADLRMASNLTYNSATSITLTVPNNYASNSNQVTYSYDSGTQRFSMSPAPFGGAAGSSLVLVRNVNSFTFARYTRDPNTSTAATSNAETKRIQVSITTRTTAAGSATTEAMTSATFTLRNKSVAAL